MKLWYNLLNWLKGRKIKHSNFENEPLSLAVNDLGLKPLTNRKSWVFFKVTMAGYGSRHIDRTIILPNNFDLDLHVERFPPISTNGFFQHTYKLKFDKGKVYYILSLLSSKLARNKSLIDDEGWIPLMEKDLKDNIRDISEYLKYLTETNVLERTNNYIQEFTPYKYRWSLPYRRGLPELRVVKIRNTKRKINDIEGLTHDPNLPEYLAHWYEVKQLFINSRVRNYSIAIYRAKLNNEIPLSINPKTNHTKDPILQYMASLYNIMRITNYAYEAKRDRNVHRLHSVITNMQSDYRNFLTFNGETLVNIDIKNSQPYLACLLLNPDFWRQDSELSLTLYHLPLNIQELFNEKDTLKQIHAFFRQSTNDEFNAYIEKVTSGDFYEQFVTLANQRLGYIIERDIAKTMMFNILFANNRGQANDPTIQGLKQLFKEEIYPKVYELFKIIKHTYSEVERESQHNRLACLLQAIESKIILDRCCKRIWEEGSQQVPVFTIHDSIATTLSNQERVENIMKEELTTAIGYPPKLDTEEWRLNNVKHPTYLQYLG